MRSLTYLSCALTFLIFAFTLPVSADAADTPAAEVQPTPQQIAARCLSRIDRATDLCIDIQQVNAAACVATINVLQHQGHDQAAHQAASTCIDSIRERTAHCRARNAHAAQQCADRLRQLGAPLLAARVLHRAAHANDRLIHARAASTRAVRNALQN